MYVYTRETWKSESVWSFDQLEVGRCQGFLFKYNLRSYVSACKSPKWYSSCAHTGPFSYMFTLPSSYTELNHLEPLWLGIESLLQCRSDYRQLCTFFYQRIWAIRKLFLLGSTQSIKQIQLGLDDKWTSQFIVFTHVLEITVAQLTTLFIRNCNAIRFFFKTGSFST